MRAFGNSSKNSWILQINPIWWEWKMKKNVRFDERTATTNSLNHNWTGHKYIHTHLGHKLISARNGQSTPSDEQEPTKKKHKFCGIPHNAQQRRIERGAPLLSTECTSSDHKLTGPAANLVRSQLNLFFSSFPFDSAVSSNFLFGVGIACQPLSAVSAVCISDRVSGRWQERYICIRRQLVNRFMKSNIMLWNTKRYFAVSWEYIREICQPAGYACVWCVYARWDSTPARRHLFNQKLALGRIIIIIVISVFGADSDHKRMIIITPIWLMADANRAE